MSIEIVHLGGTGPASRVRRAALGTVVAAGTRPFLNGRVSLPVRRRVLSVLGRAASPVPRDVAVDVVVLGGVRTWRLTPKGASTNGGLLVLHGGGYNYGDLGTHGGSYATLARLLGVTAWMPDYRLVPEHRPEDAIDDAVTAWTALHEGADGRRRGTVAVTGDSAGAGLALGLACEARDRGLAEASCLLLHSPWVDADPALLPVRREDRILHRSLMERDGGLWRGGRDASDPVLSPIRRDLHDLPPTLVQWGQHEALHLDAEALVAKLEASDVDVTGEAHPGLWHDAQLHVPGLVESRRWLARTARFAASYPAAA